MFIEKGFCQFIDLFLCLFIQDFELYKLIKIALLTLACLRYKLEIKI